MTECAKRPRPPVDTTCWRLDGDTTATLLPFLSDAALATLACASRALRGPASCKVEWGSRLARLWQDKDFQPAVCLALLEAANPQRALFESLADRARTEITSAELGAREWCFRFKENAGEQWTGEDPWWSGGAPWRVRFLPSGKLVFCGRPGPSLDGGTLEWAFAHSGSDKRRGGGKRKQRRQRGSFVEVTLRSRGGGRHTFPRYDVRRHDVCWGWYMHSYW